MSESFAPQQPPTPEAVFAALWAFHQTNALVAALELDLFTAVGSGADTPAKLAQRAKATERGVRILCDYLTIQGFLLKNGASYALTPTAATFLDRRSPAYLGSMAQFLSNETSQKRSMAMAQTVRRGADDVVFEPDWEGWITFARTMTPMMAPQAEFIAQRFAGDRAGKVLDIAAGHGLYGLAFARRNPKLEIVALDWPAVLEVAKENAAKAGVGSDRYHLLPGSALDVDYGHGYQTVLLTNFLHHFDTDTCERILRKVLAALAPGGQALILEFVPNDDRVSPPMAASFSLQMLIGTPAGDAYTWKQLRQMLENAGFREPAIEAVPQSPQSLLSAKKAPA
ncbi:MAG: methyltransferase [Terriglobales bacterium]